MIDPLRRVYRRDATEIVVLRLTKSERDYFDREARNRNFATSSFIRLLCDKITQDDLAKAILDD